MSGGEIAAILVAVFGGVPAVSLTVGNVRKAIREGREARDNAIREQMRAEFYKVQSEATISQKNAEIDTWKEKHATDAARLRNIVENEWPRLRTQLEEQREIILNLSRQVADS